MPAPQLEGVDRRPDSGSLDESGEEGVEYLTRGPLHEAFANAYTSGPQPQPVTPKAPPEPIDEIPPSYQPEGKNVEWISGYWEWDEDRSDFIWISGVWRKVPPGQRWVPGYWEQADDGYRRVAGFWTSAASQSIEYLPAPPDPVEEGPSAPQPGDDYFYVPGHWDYQANDYRWTPGFWAQSQPDWIWSPAQYVWTPRGCVYRPGYWDYAIDRRGTLFTPVYYRQPIYTRPGFSYRPRYVLGSGLNLLVHLFFQPRYGRYYFGDYYGGGYQSRLFPWVNYFGRGSYYDPIFSYYSVRSRGGQRNVIGWVNDRHSYYRSNERMRPPHDIASQRQFLKNNPSVESDLLATTALAAPIENRVKGNSSEGKFKELSRSQAESIRDQVRESQQRLSENRKQFEKSARSRSARESVAGATESQGPETLGSEARGNGRGPRGETSGRVQGSDSNSAGVERFGREGRPNQERFDLGRRPGDLSPGNEGIRDRGGRVQDQVRGSKPDSRPDLQNRSRGPDSSRGPASARGRLNAPSSPAPDRPQGASPQRSLRPPTGPTRSSTGPRRLQSNRGQPMARPSSPSSGNRPQASRNRGPSGGDKIRGGGPPSRGPSSAGGGGRGNSGKGGGGRPGKGGGGNSGKGGGKGKK
ncbi:hypothetical protein [Roseiconus nitratireducens]|uniref:hypothetical protein n=1 Tax=Roseiconus nitratireducens TaxID=2605748 RepID=UPI001F1F30EB|nr:hypothetical protein [Roseiconus nitratireducens]